VIDKEDGGGTPGFSSENDSTKNFFHSFKIT
jgi:hypothetical protein